MRRHVHIEERYRPVIESLGLTDLDRVKAFPSARRGRNKSEITRLDNGTGRALYLKRYWACHRKNGLKSLLRRGTVWSLAREEWNNCQLLQKAGFETSPLVAYGEQCGVGWEKFSFIITEQVPGIALSDFLERTNRSTDRRKLLQELARFLADLHDKGFSYPDLYTRHIYLAPDRPARFRLIDVARLDSMKAVSSRLRARDLAALNATTRRGVATQFERLRFLRWYRGRKDMKILRLIAARMGILRQRSKFQEFNH